MTERKFEIVSKYKDQDIHLPVRQTVASAGYDIEAAEDVLVVPDLPALVPTGIKVKMPKDEALLLLNRSSNPKKRGLILPNGVGLIDADYYNNESNEGEIFGQFMAIDVPYQIHKGDRIMQGVFINYLVTTDDDATGKRTGGIGSTDDKANAKYDFGHNVWIPQ